jgi:hypothetical protein
MNKYLMLTAASILAGTAGASAGTFCFTFASTIGDEYCDGGIVRTRVDGAALSGAVRAWVHTNNNCMGGTSQGYGLLARTSGLGKVSVMSDDFFAKNYGNFSTAVSYTLPKQIKNAQPWTGWIGMNGTTYFEFNSGILDIYGKCQKPAAKRGMKSTLDGVKEIIAAHRNAKALSE